MTASGERRRSVRSGSLFLAVVLTAILPVDNSDSSSSFYPGELWATKPQKGLTDITVLVVAVADHDNYGRIYMVQTRRSDRSGYCVGHAISEWDLIASVTELLQVDVTLPDGDGHKIDMLRRGNVRVFDELLLGKCSEDKP